jgi:hypothetical protein
MALLSSTGAWALDGPATDSLESSLGQLEAPESSRKYDLSARASLTGDDVAQGLNSGQIMRFRVDGQASYRFSPELRTDVLIEGAFDTGRTQAVTDDSESHVTTIATKSRIEVREAAVTATPWEWSEFRTGALSQDSLDAPLLFYRTTFPAASEALVLKGSLGRLQAGLEQAIPTGRTLATQATEVEPMPRLAIESIQGTLNLTKRWTLTGYVHHFSIFDLPSAVAIDSRLAGNTVDGDKDARFTYGFQGYAAGLSTELPVLQVTTTRIGADYLQNVLAPEGHNTGYLVFNEWKIRLNDRYDLLPRYTYFLNESDSSPAYYNNWSYGHNNTFGQEIELGLHFKKMGFTVGGRMSQNRSLETTPYQNANDLNHVYLLTMESDYVSL